MKCNKVSASLLKALFIVVVEIIYTIFFGQHNIVVGMIMTMGAIQFLDRDLTGALLYRILSFLILNILLGILSYLAVINIYVGFFINFFTIFITTYVYMNDFRSPTSFIFLMLYIFMWATPVSFNQLPNRLLAISVSISIIILLQIVFNRNKFKKESSLIVKNIVDDINANIDDIKNGEYNINKTIKINKNIKTLLELISERSHGRILKLKYEIEQFNIAICLDRLNLIISNTAKYKKDKNIKNEYLEDVKSELNNIYIFYKNTKDIESINNTIDVFINKYEKIKNKPVFIYESIDLLKLFKFNINNDYKIKDNKSKKVYKIIRLSTHFKILKIMKENFNLNSLKFIYSFKLGLSISITMLLVQILNISYGKWIIITIYVVTQPYAEDTIVKAKKRFRGTFIGVILFLLIFNIMDSNIHKMIVVTIAFYCYFYYKEYDKKVMSMTVVSLTTLSISPNISSLTIDRIIFIMIGISMALIFNRYFLSYNISNSMDELKYKYQKNKKEMLKELDKVLNGNGDLEKLIKLTLTANQIESKLIENNNRFKDKKVEILIYRQSIIMSDARFLLLKLYNNYQKQ